MAGMSAGEIQYRLAFEISPIYLTGGIAQNVPGATIPLISYTEGEGFDNILEASSNKSLDDYFAHFIPIPGSLLVNNAIGQYPFANQSVAANAIIFEPLQISLLMICPARAPGGMLSKQSVMTSLKRTLDEHNLAGGMYSIATPSFLYENCVMLRMIDASIGETRQVQYRYQLDFLRPLVTLEEAQQSYNNLMAKINSQTQIQADANGEIGWSGSGIATGNPSSGVSSDIVPATGTDPGLGYAPSTQITDPSSIGDISVTQQTEGAFPSSFSPVDTGASLINIPSFI